VELKEKREFHKRVWAATIFVPVILGIVWVGGLAFLLLVALLIGLGLWEFYELCEKMDFSPFKILGITGGVGLAIMIYLNNLRIGSYLGSNGTAFLLFVLILLGYLLSFCRKQSFDRVLLDLAMTFLGIAYVSWLWSHLILLREFRPGGMQWTFSLIFTIWLMDVGCYGVGLKFGRHKLASRLSPHKTVEGALGGLVVALLTTVVCWVLFLQNLTSLPRVMVLGLIIGVLAQLSDLSESLLKRAAGVKDSSGLIPGHGGILDRFDSFFFSAPFLYYYLIFF